MLPLLVMGLFAFVLAQASNSTNSTAATSVQIAKTPRHTFSPDLMSSIDAHRSSKLASLASNTKTVAPAAATSGIPANLTQFSHVSPILVQNAKALVAAAQESQAAYNQYQINNPRRNTHLSRKSASAGDAKVKRAADAVAQPVHSSEVMDAVKLLGNINAYQRASNGTLLKKFPPHNNTGDNFENPHSKLHSRSKLERRVENDHFWMPNMEHLGTQPFGGDISYQVWRSVADYGAYGDGSDDTAAINAAIADGSRCGENCLSSSVKAAIIYFPLGTYRITSPIIMYYNTQLVGYIPTAGFTTTIQVDPNFTGFGVITSDIYLPGGQSEWYIEQSNFYRQIRNFDIDMTLATMEGINGIHWQVAQATSISNVAFYMSDKSSSTQIGIYAENGSGGWMSDISFTGGMWGILGGNQQYTVRAASFMSVANAIGMIWDWGWTWSQLSITNCNTGINLAAPGASPSDPVGSLYLMDSMFTNTPTMIYTYPWLGVEEGTTVISLDNVQMIGVDYVFSFTNGYVSTISTSSAIDFITIGNLESDGEFYGAYYINDGGRPSVLVDEDGEFYAKETWFSRSKPSYYQYDESMFFNAKWYAAGDGVTDDTAWIQAMLNYCAGGVCVLFFPAGSYIITSTIVIPIDSYIVGETWSQIVASGSVFASASAPTAAIVVGGAGDAPGSIEIQDMLFTSIGNLPGLVLILWQAESSILGSCAMWDSHVRIGGALGTNLQVGNCPILSGGIKSACVADFAMMVIETTGYFENMWAWVADHDLDDPANVQVDVYGGRGIMIYGDGPNWFWGTASEHSVLYQYGLIETSNVFMSMIQTESPYFQGSANTQAPLPFDQVVLFLGDPAWEDCGSATLTCNMAWALVITSSSDVYINGAGLYSWFQNYDEACVGTANCQQKMIYTYDSTSLWLNHVITIGAIEMITPGRGNAVNDIIIASQNLQGAVYPWWSVVAMYLDSTPVSTTSFPVQTGWVAFGDSYAAGIGAGAAAPGDVAGCYRSLGGYPWYLNAYFQANPGVPTLNFRPLPCSGDVADNVTSATGQISQWIDPIKHELATLSIIGNDLNFGTIVKTCIVGYGEKGDTCDSVLTTSEALLADGVLDIDILLYSVWRGILDKAINPRFVIYQTGYPQFFEAVDNQCNTSRFRILLIYYGEYLLIPLRDRMNALSEKLNDKIRTLIAQWNSNLNHAQIIFVEPDPVVYPGHRFCEEGVNEPVSGDAQNNVAFFYPDGQDYSPANVDLGFVGDGTTTTYNSNTCAGIAFADWVDDILCTTAITAAANPTEYVPLIQADFTANFEAGASVTQNSDGSVTITDFKLRYLKIFHPKSKYNQQIAVLIYNEVVRRMPFA